MSGRNIRLLLIGVAVVLVLAGAVAAVFAFTGGEDAKSSEDVPADAVALVGDEPVPKAEVDALMAQAEKSYKAQKQPFPKPGTPQYATLRGQAVRYLVQRAQFRQEADAMGLEVSDSEIDKRMTDYIKQVADGDEKKFDEQLKDQGLTRDRVREDIRMQLLQEKIYEAVTGKLKVTDKDVEKYYKDNDELFKRPSSRKVRHILVKRKALADELYAQLQDGGNFAALAKEHSQDPGTKNQGGRYTATKGQSFPPFDKAAFALKTREISKPVKTQAGWHIIQPLSAVRPESVTPLAQVKDTIREQLLRQKQSEAIKKWVEQVEDKYDDDVVYAVGYAPPPTTTSAQTETQ